MVVVSFKKLTFSMTFIYFYIAMLITFRLNDSAEIFSENRKIFHLSFSVIVLVTLEEFPLDLRCNNGAESGEYLNTELS